MFGSMWKEICKHFTAKRKFIVEILMWFISQNAFKGIKWYKDGKVMPFKMSSYALWIHRKKFLCSQLRYYTEITAHEAGK